jgi:hypothetical protein
MPLLTQGTTTVRITPVRVESRIEDNQVTCDLEIEVDVFGLNLKVRRSITVEGAESDAIRGQVDSPAALEPLIRAALIDEEKVPETAIVAELAQEDYDAKVRRPAVTR